MSKRRNTIGNLARLGLGIVLGMLVIGAMLSLSLGIYYD